MKKFTEMSAAERIKWLSKENEEGRLNTDHRSVVERIVETLTEHGPLTIAEVAEKMHYRKVDSLIAWSNRKSGKEQMKKHGIIRHRSPDNGRISVWLLDIHLREEGEPERVSPSVLERMSSKKE